MGGYKRKVEELKVSGDMSQQEGKAPMSKEGYLYLAKLAYHNTKDFALLTHVVAFLLLCWNLMARAVSVNNILFEHISWDGDAMTINFGATKGDQEGRNAHARHVYANPKNPYICPIVAFAVHVFTLGFRPEGSSTQVFGTKNSGKDRFCKWLRNVVSDNADVILAMGLIISDIGSHSFRKGIASIVANCPGGPTAISIWLRAGWSLGSVQSRYIFQGSGGDQFVGRAATLIDLNSEEFATLPPHFDTSEGPVLTTEQWEDVRCRATQ